MELRHIRYFLAVVEEGNVTKAAEKLMIAQPPLSRQIHDLEEELGTALFLRQPRGVTLTEAGNRFLNYARQIDELARRSCADLRDLKSGLKGTIYLATVEGRAPKLLSGWIARFHKEYPGVEYDLWNGNTDDVINRLHNGLCDMAVITAPYDQEHFEGVEVGREPWVAILPKHHPLAEPGDEIELARLADQELIIPSRQSRKQEIEDWFAPLGVKPVIIARLAHMLNAYELSAHGLGIAIFPAAANEYTTKDVVIKKIVHPERSASYLLIRRKEGLRTNVAGEFWDFVSRQYRETAIS